MNTENSSTENPSTEYPTIQNSAIQTPADQNRGNTHEDAGLARIGMAEFLAANELTEDIGVAMSFAESVGQLMARQARAYIQAHADGLNKLSSQPLPLVVLEVGIKNGLIAAEGALSFNELCLKQTAEISQIHNTLWEAFGKTAKGKP